MIPQPFIDAIKANRNDDLPRLIAADWLDDHGEVERAEFIRVQCELANTECERATEVKCITGWGIKYWCSKCLRIDKLRRRERDLLNDGPGIEQCNWRIWSRAPWVAEEAPTTLHGSLFTRGFISIITLSWADWFQHHAAILKATPLERVRLTTMPTITESRPNWPQTILGRQEFSRWPGIEFELPQQPRLVYGHTQYT